MLTNFLWAKYIHFSLCVNIVCFLQICFRLCDKFLPEEPILSEENHLIVHFYSDHISRFDGFFATYEVIRKCEIQLFKPKLIKFVVYISINTHFLSGIKTLISQMANFNFSRRPVQQNNILVTK